METARVEILANGLVQGVGFRYFVVKNAQRLGLKGFTQNLYSGEVLTVAEGPRNLLEELYNQIKVGPPYADVNNASIKWSEPKNEFTHFEIKH